MPGTARRTSMKKKEMKKLLASLGIASLISAGSMALPGTSLSASG